MAFDKLYELDGYRDYSGKNIYHSVEIRLNNMGIKVNGEMTLDTLLDNYTKYRPIIANDYLLAPLAETIDTINNTCHREME